MPSQIHRLYFFLPGQLGYLISQHFDMKVFVSLAEQTHYSVMKTKWLQEHKKQEMYFPIDKKAKYLSETIQGLQRVVYIIAIGEKAIKWTL